MAVLHGGDIVSLFAVRLFKGLDAKLYFVFGNDRGDKSLLIEWFGDFGAEACGIIGDLMIEDRHVALLYGINEAEVRAIVA